MPHTITLSDATFTMLETLAKPFVDTPESVIAALAEQEISNRAAGSPHYHALAPGGDDGIQRLDPDRHVSLTHAKLLSASFDGTDIHRPKWNSLLDHVHIFARQRVGSYDALEKISGAHIRSGRYDEDGFHYLVDADLSIQGVDSNLAWTHALGIARHLKVPIRVKFEWRRKDGAARPGKVAILEWSPSNLAVA